MYKNNCYCKLKKEIKKLIENYDDTQVQLLITLTNANFANYYTKSESYSASEIDTLLRTQRQGEYVVVETLPEPSADTIFKIYLAPSINPETLDIKDEFVTLENDGTYSWEKIGSTVVDLSNYSTTEEMNDAIANALSNYYTKTEINEALNNKQEVIQDLDNIRSGANLGSTSYQKPDTGIPASDIANGVIPTIPTNVSAFNNDANYLTQHQDISGKADISDVEDIKALIPTQATSENKLADKDFVNSSISTATADFKGTVNSLVALDNITADKNDYAFVVTTDSNGNTVYKRYKYNDNAWEYEYDLNNSSFTAAQWAAIQSNITQALVNKLNALPTNDALTTSLDNKVDKVTDKGLSTNDYTTAEKDKLAGIAEGAEPNIQSNWNQTDSSADDFIKNKPTIPDITGKSDKVTNATSGNLAGLDVNGNLTDSGIAADEVVASTTVHNIVVLTLAQYDALATKDTNTEYNIIESV